MKFHATAIALSFIAAPALAQVGDAEAGEKAFRQCKACHMVVDDSGEAIVRGGQTGPNLYGLSGRTAGSAEDFNYSDLLIAAGEAGLKWDQESFTGFVQNPTPWLKEYTGESGRGKMTYRLRKEEDAADIWAFLVSIGPQN